MFDNFEQRIVQQIASVTASKSNRLRIPTDVSFEGNVHREEGR